MKLAPGFEDRRVDGVFHVSGGKPDALAIRELSDTNGSSATPSFHLIDTTMMYAPRSGGVKRYLTAKRTWLEKRRPDIRHTLVVPGKATRLQASGLYTVSATKLPFGDGYRMPASPNKWAAVLGMLQPDIIEAGDVLVPGHAALIAGQTLGVPVVAACHTDAPTLAALHLGEWAEQPTFNLWAQAYRRFDHVIAPSRHSASRLAEAGVKDVSVHPLGVDLELFHPSRGDRAALLKRLDFPSNARLLVFAGRPAREKNIDSMVAAVEMLGDPYRLVLIGAGKDSRYPSSVACIDFEGEPEKLAGVIASCDAFIHANENEVFGLVVIEAMAAGLPVIGPDKGGVGELLDESIGQLAAGVDPASLAAATEALFARDLPALKLAARHRAETRHSWDHTFEGLTRLYARLLTLSARRAPMRMSA
ncbi:glycosyltransferase [Phenylobacterium sp.]|uniref:glycosyltransferase n=1 Tax=Phenylobacterium sp. TaxID=1871053 RepID=UPI002E2F44C4|nr:glycosyltransferase [Phenylobacterium sp.]HEX3366544.1 glycosyltransferase [Phenylobacterium sp.]